jgi:hypothetical protein
VPPLRFGAFLHALPLRFGARGFVFFISPVVSCLISL